MRKYVCLLVFASLLLLTYRVMEVQSSMRDACYANVPFDFYVGNSKMSAGVYTIQESNSGNAQLLVQKKGGGTGAYVFSVGADPKSSDASGKLIFHRYNDDYFLSEIWKVGNEMGHVIHPSRKELELEKGASQVSKASSVNSKMVTIALK